MTNDILNDEFLFGEYRQFVSEKVWDYFLEEYKKRSWRGYPSGLPYMDTKTDVDTWLNNSENEVNELIKQLKQRS